MKRRVVITACSAITPIGYDKKDIIEAINKTKIYEFILKPFEPEDLKLRIKRAIEAFESQKKLEEYLQVLEERIRELEQKNKELEEAKRKLEESGLIDPLTGNTDEYI